MNRAAARGDAAAFLAVLTAGCAFPAPDEPEPWAALLLLAWALGQSYSADWSLPGDVLDAALNTAVHRRGDALLRDLLACSPRSRSGSRRQPFGTGGCWSARSTTTADGKP